MDNFKVIYRILRLLEKSMDCEEFNTEAFTAKEFGLNEPHFARLLKMLVESGYISGVEVWNVRELEYPRYKIVRPEITLKGLEYLNDNSLMKKAAELAKGVFGVAGSII